MYWLFVNSAQHPGSGLIPCVVVAGSLPCPQFWWCSVLSPGLCFSEFADNHSLPLPVWGGPRPLEEWVLFLEYWEPRLGKRKRGKRELGEKEPLSKPGCDMHLHWCNIAKETHWHFLGTCCVSDGGSGEHIGMICCAPTGCLPGEFSGTWEACIQLPSASRSETPLSSH